MLKKFSGALVFTVIAGALLLAPGCATVPPEARTITRLGFGSCINPATHPMLDRVLTLDFDAFVLLGDNIYADTTNMTVMAEKYRVRKESAFFRALRKKAPLLATWMRSWPFAPTTWFTKTR